MQKARGLRRGLAGAALFVVVAGCGGGGGGPMMGVADAGGGDGGTSQDAGSTDGASIDGGLLLPFEVAPPEIPWLEEGMPPIAHPVLTPCPDGWTETDLAGETTCEPWPAGSYSDCGPGEAQLIGGTGCAPLGGACPTSDFAEDLPAGVDVVYVREGAAVGGDGTMATPYGTLAEALDPAPPGGTVIALAKGSYEGAVLPPGLVLVGACAADTVITPPVDAPYAIELTAGTLEARRLRIEANGARGLFVSGAGTTARLRAVEVHGAACHGLDVFDESLVDMEELVVRDTTGCADPNARSAGLNGEGATLLVRTSLFANNGHSAIVAKVDPEHDTPSELVLEDSVVRDQRDTSHVPHAVWTGHHDDDGPSTAPSTVTIRRTLIEDNRAGGLTVRGERTVADLDQLLARGNGSQDPTDSQPAMLPLSVFDGASLDLHRTAITGTRSSFRWAAVMAVRPGPSALEDVVIADNQGMGLGVQGVDARVSVRRAHMSGNAGGDVRLDGGQLTLEDAVLGDYPSEGTLDSLPADVRAQGILGGGHADLRRVSIADGAGAGLHLALLSGTISPSVMLEDVAIVRTRPLMGAAGWGIFGGRGTSVTGRRVLVEGSHMSGIELTTGSGSSLVLEDAVVRDTRPYPGEEVGGRGVVLGYGSTGEVRRTRIDNSHELGLATFGSVTTLEDVEILRTDVAACAALDACLPLGHALGIYSESTLAATRFIVSDAATCGVHLALGAEADLSDGLVTRNEVGACVQVDGYDLSRLQDGVFYVDNGRNLLATEQPANPGG